MEMLLEDIEILTQKIKALASAIHILRLDMESEDGDSIARDCLTVIEDSARSTYDYANRLKSKIKEHLEERA